jgi:hypothetical protein
VRNRQRDPQDAITRPSAGALSCAIATNTTAISYRDVACAVSGKPEVAVVTAPAKNSLPERSIVLGDNTSNASDGDFETQSGRRE